ncbi:MAG: site-specific integrase [Planctomycetota bacterium]|nr:MAG: site-specific integrase [Planctomycetota bacterium]REJ95036.1 MAG: site-specific integrase [Planctomycetota bacterium]REK24567.1 MAG: site-specific integrase [Planctomycetota bacterium]REK49192.1 MAG: site-specific integrase [Planctomycetota bacterium]
MFQSDIKVRVVKYPDRKNYMMRYEDPVTGQQVARSTRTFKRREAERAASVWEKELREGKYRSPSRITWEHFRERCEEEKLSALSPHTFDATTCAFNYVEEIINPKMLASVTSAALSRLQADLRKAGIKETSIATHLRHLRAALSWAVSMGMIPEVPDIVMPRRAKGMALMRGRPIKAREFKKLLAAARSVRPRDWRYWQYYLKGLWLSGLRLEESTVFGWDDMAPISVDLTGRRPRFRIYAEAEKGQRDRLLPMTPDFARFLLKTPKAERSGKVFRLIGLSTGIPITPKRISRIVSAMGKKAGIVVNEAEEKYGSAHDLRRSFGTRWASRVKPATLQLLMRHKSIETTLRYYISLDADELADQLWEEFGES